MSIITLTTDYGLQDAFVARLKVQLLKADSQAQFIEVSHDTAPFNLQEAAYNLRQVVPICPQGTIHICTVVAESVHRYLAIFYRGQYFLVPDNGIFFLAVDTANYQVSELVVGNTLEEKLIHAVRYINKGLNFPEIGIPAGDIIEKRTLQPITNANYIRGSIIHVDRYGNAVTNISKSMLDEIRKERNIEITLSRNDLINTIDEDNDTATIGAFMAQYNDLGYLQILNYLGNAAELLDMDLGDTIQVNFVSTAS